MPTNIITTNSTMYSSTSARVDKQGRYLRRWDDDINSADGYDEVAMSDANVERSEASRLRLRLEWSVVNLCSLLRFTIGEWWRPCMVWAYGLNRSEHSRDSQINKSPRNLRNDFFELSKTRKLVVTDFENFSMSQSSRLPIETLVTFFLFDNSYGVSQFCWSLYTTMCEGRIRYDVSNGDKWLGD